MNKKDTFKHNIYILLIMISLFIGFFLGNVISPILPPITEEEPEINLDEPWSTIEDNGIIYVYNGDGILIESYIINERCWFWKDGKCVSRTTTFSQNIEDKKESYSYYYFYNK